MNKSPNRYKHLFRALSSGNYRLFFFGQGISLIGTWIQSVAQAWLVYKMTNSVLLLGLVGFLGQIMIFIFGPFAGVIADRMNRHRILVITQTSAMIQAFILSALVLTRTVQVWHIMVLSLLLGIINSFDVPVRQSFVIEMVERKEDIGNAIALNSSLVNSARLIGPTIAGVLIAAFGEGLCFFVNGISYIAVIISLLLMKITPKMARTTRDSRVFKELKEGISYAAHFPPIKYVLLSLAGISLIAAPYMVLMPVVAKDVLHGGPQTMGWLMSSAGCGALLGALYLASRKNVVGLLKTMVVASLVFGFSLIAFSLSSDLRLSCFFLLLTGCGMVTQMASSNTILQTIVDEDKRGRVMSLYTIAFLGMTPFGSLYAGTFAHMFGVRPTIALSGTCCVLIAFAFYSKLPEIRTKIRPIYVKMGIIPEIAKAIDTVSDIEVIADKE
jgi:MFS family permease